MISECEGKIFGSLGQIYSKIIIEKIFLKYSFISYRRRKLDGKGDCVNICKDKYQISFFYCIIIFHVCIAIPWQKDKESVCPI